jgi:hypothetical protein
MFLDQRNYTHRETVVYRKVEFPVVQTKESGIILDQKSYMRREAAVYRTLPLEGSTMSIGHEVDVAVAAAKGR